MCFSKMFAWSVLLLFALGPVGFAAEWPRFLGPDGNGISPETGINKNWKAKPPRILWKTEMHDNGFAGPCVADGKVFIIDHKGEKDIVRAIDINTGKDVWRYAYPDSKRQNYGFARSTPTYENGRLYTLSRLGLVHCLNAKNGAKIWMRNIIKDFGGRIPSWQLAMSPVIDGEKLIVCPGGNDAAVVALDKATGKTIWRGGGSDKPGYATPVVAVINGQKQYVVFTAKALIGVAANNGRLLWRVPWKTAYDVNAATPLVLGSSIFITSNYRHGCALVDVSAAGARIVWQNKEMQAHFSTPVFYNGYIYGTGNPGYLMCIDPRTGKALWKQKGFERGGVVVVDGVLIAMNGRGGDVVMVALDPKGYKELGRIKPLGSQSWTAPIVAEGKLIVRNKHALACLDLK